MATPSLSDISAEQLGAMPVEQCREFIGFEGFSLTRGYAVPASIIVVVKRRLLKLAEKGALSGKIRRKMISTTWYLKWENGFLQLRFNN